MSSDSRTRRDELERPTGAHELIAMETSHADIEDRDERAPEEGNQHQTIVYLQGWRLHSLTFATTLVAITNSLNGFQKNNWIVTSYLLTYAGMPPYFGSGGAF
ncbi:uncharacterized protein KY384_000395 [Bacidia gigantensis]|uniref:uncharacterized protein n=1 Tax=Bacidia gigantensis TaxID=2732470 RepID=UPI001D0581EF|nr:uncharacterized protein KY384_000395 [Bacidia gigantensis]KAG8526401.1 hypothetical protein KY384_000395 [Bacidia gigantensis]